MRSAESSSHRYHLPLSTTSTSAFYSIIYPFQTKVVVSQMGFQRFGSARVVLAPEQNFERSHFPRGINMHDHTDMSARAGRVAYHRQRGPGEAVGGGGRVMN